MPVYFFTVKPSDYGLAIPTYPVSELPDDLLQVGELRIESISMKDMLITGYISTPIKNGEVPIISQFAKKIFVKKTI